jgi:hypothetical protein
MKLMKKLALTHTGVAAALRKPAQVVPDLLDLVRCD